MMSWCGSTATQPGELLRQVPGSRCVRLAHQRHGGSTGRSRREASTRRGRRARLSPACRGGRCCLPCSGWSSSPSCSPRCADSSCRSLTGTGPARSSRPTRPARAEEVIARVRRVGASGALTVRGDAGFWNDALIDSGTGRARLGGWDASGHGWPDRCRRGALRPEWLAIRRRPTGPRRCTCAGSCRSTPTRWWLPR